MNTTTTLGDVQKKYYEKTMLIRALPSLIFYDLGKKQGLPSREGKTVSYRRFNALPLATTPLTEGTNPAPVSMSRSEVTVQVQYLGNYEKHSDQVELHDIDPYLQEVSEVFGENAGQSVDAYVRDVVASGTNVIYANGTSRSAVGSTHILSMELIRQAVTQLQINNARKFGGPSENLDPDLSGYILAIHPFQATDLTRDSEFKLYMQSNSNNNTYATGKLPDAWGCQIKQSTLAPVWAGAGASGANVYGALLIAKDAFGVTDVAGFGKFQMKVKAIGSAGAEDALDMFGTVGWKSAQANVILNNNFMVRIETGATNG